MGGFLPWLFFSHFCPMGVGIHLDVASGCLGEGFSCLVLSWSAEERLDGVSLESKGGWTCTTKMYEGEQAFKFFIYDSTGCVYTYLKRALHYRPSISNLQSC
jgi:hypothetical protein